MYLIDSDNGHVLSLMNAGFRSGVSFKAHYLGGDRQLGELWTWNSTYTGPKDCIGPRGFWEWGDDGSTD